MAETLSRKTRPFKDYLFGTLLHPRRTFDRLLMDERRLKLGFYAMLISVVLDLGWYEVQLNTPTIWRTILFTLYGIALVLLFAYLIIGMHKAQKIKPGLALWIGCIAAIVYQVVFLVFNR